MKCMHDMENIYERVFDMERNNMKKTWAVIGGGNGGQGAAGHLGLMGFPVRLYDIFEETIEVINKQKGIHLKEGSINGFGPVEFATTSMEKVVKDADVIMIIAPAIVHRKIAEDMAPHLKDGQIIFIHPGATGGALEFKAVFNQNEIQKNVVIVEAMTLLYACRAIQPGTVSVYGTKQALMCAALPSNATHKALCVLKEAYPELYPGKNVLQTSLENLNTIMHPGPTLLNTSLIESKHDFKYYWDGITPSIGKIAERVDNERLALADSFGIDVLSIKEWYKKLYDVSGESLTEICQANEAYGGIMGQSKMETRYLLEDIPMGLVPMIELAKKTGTSTACMKTIADLGSYMMDKDLFKRGRTLESLGIDSMSLEEILAYVETGEVA